MHVALTAHADPACLSRQDTGRDGVPGHGDRHEPLPEDFLLNDAAFVPEDSEAEFMGLLAHVEAGGNGVAHGYERVRPPQGI